MTAPQILFVVDAGPAVGAERVARALTLGRAMEAHGASYAFVGPPDLAVLLEALAPGAPRIAAEDLAAAAVRESFDAIVFDHDGLSAADHRAMAQGRPVLVIDDAADRPIGGDIVVAAGPERRAEDYLGLAPETARLLIGPGFALVRPEFAALRDPALAWRGEPVQRVLMAMAPGDVGAVTAQVLERVRPRTNDAGFDIVLAEHAASLPGLRKIARRDGRVMLHVGAAHTARLAAEADIGIGEPGPAALERCALGLPSLLVVTSDGQRAHARRLAEQGAALTADIADPQFDLAFDRALMRLLRDAELRRTLAAQSSELVDGLGAGRVAEAFLDLIAAR